MTFNEHDICKVIPPTGNLPNLHLGKNYTVGDYCKLVKTVKNYPDIWVATLLSNNQEIMVHTGMISKLTPVELTALNAKAVATVHEEWAPLHR